MSLREGSFELRELQQLEGHTERVWCVAWKPKTGVDGVPAVLASCGGDKTVRIWVQSPATGSFQCKAVLDETHTRTVRYCEWSPSGEFLVTASFDATTAIWKEVDGDYRCISTLEGHENEVKSASWNGSSKLLATCGRDKTVWIWHFLSDNDVECLGVLTEHTQDVKMVRWHPDMDVLFSCSYDNTIKVWWDEGSDDWMCFQTLDEDENGHTSTVWALSFNPAGDRMVTCSDDLTLKIWVARDLDIMQVGEGYADWEHMCTLSGYHDRAIFSVHWSSDGIIASGAADNAICLFGENEDDQSLSSSTDSTVTASSQPFDAKYRLLLKKDKVHDMDVNSVHWCFGANRYLESARHHNTIIQENRILASASDDKTIKIWALTFVAGHEKPTP